MKYEELITKCRTTNGSGREIFSYAELSVNELVDLIVSSDTYDFPADESGRTPFEVLEYITDLSCDEDVESFLDKVCAWMRSTDAEAVQK